MMNTSTDNNKASVEAESAQVKLICMSFDGEYVTEGSFKCKEDAWNHA